MRRTKAFGRRGKSRVLRYRRELPVKGAGRRRDFLDAPCHQLFHRVDGRRQQGKIGTFSHVEAASAVVVLVGVKNQAGEVPGTGADDPVFFERATIVPPGRNVEQSGGVRPHQPLVIRCDREVGLDFIGDGDFFGELSVIDGQPAPEYIIAVAPSRLTFLDRDRARDLMFGTPQSSEAVAARLAERMRKTASHRAVLALPSSFQRVCAQLVLLAQKLGDGRMVIVMPPTHQEIAIMVNTSRETVTRTLQFLQSQKVVARAGNELLVEQPGTLQDAADGKVAPGKS